MAGEIGTNYYNQSLYNQFNNPYLMQNSASMNDDFMAQSVFGNSAQQATLANYANYANYANVLQGNNLQGNLTGDTYQTSTLEEGGSSLGSTLLTGAAVGGATGAGMYYFGTNPMKDGKVTSSFSEFLEKQAATTKYNELYSAKATQIYNTAGIANAKEFETVKTLASLTKLEDLSQELRANLPSSIQTPEAAKKAIEKINPELAKIDTKALTAQAETFAKNNGAQKLVTNFTTHWDKETKAFKEGAPKELGEALKNFKWKKAGKAGLIAAGVAIVGKLLFGGKSEA